VGTDCFPAFEHERQENLSYCCEITLLAGGLGRVMQYLAGPCIKWGLRLFFVEPGYPFRIDSGQERLKPLDYGKFAYSALQIGIEPEFKLTLPFRERKQK